MPIYEYQCQQCKHKLEVMQRIGDEPLKTCPACAQDALKKLISAVGFQLKGTGWYETDFKTKSKPKADAGADKEGSSEAKNDKERASEARNDKERASEARNDKERASEARNDKERASEAKKESSNGASKESSAESKPADSKTSTRPSSSTAED